MMGHGRFRQKLARTCPRLCAGPCTSRRGCSLRTPRTRTWADTARARHDASIIFLGKGPRCPRLTLKKTSLVRPSAPKLPDGSVERPRPRSLAPVVDELVAPAAVVHLLLPPATSRGVGGSVVSLVSALAAPSGPPARLYAPASAGVRGTFPFPLPVSMSCVSF